MIVTPEVAQPTKPGEPAPLPYFPRDFLKPITPEAQRSAPPATRSDTKAPASGKGGRRWFGLRSASK